MSVVMATKKKTTSKPAPKKGKVTPNVPKAGFKPGHRFCGGGKLK